MRVTKVTQMTFVTRNPYSNQLQNLGSDTMQPEEKKENFDENSMCSVSMQMKFYKMKCFRVGNSVSLFCRRYGLSYNCIDLAIRIQQGWII